MAEAGSEPRWPEPAQAQPRPRFSTLRIRPAPLVSSIHMRALAPLSLSILLGACVSAPAVDTTLQPAPLRAAVVVLAKDGNLVAVKPVATPAVASGKPAVAAAASSEKSLSSRSLDRLPLRAADIEQAFAGASAFAGMQMIPLPARSAAAGTDPTASTTELRRLLAKADAEKCDVLIVVRGTQDGPLVETADAGFWSMNSFLGGALVGSMFLWTLPDTVVRTDVALIADVYQVPDTRGNFDDPTAMTMPIAVPEMAILPAERINGLWTGIGMILVPYLLKTDITELQQSVVGKIPAALRNSGLKSWSATQLVASLKVIAEVKPTANGRYQLRVRHRDGRRIEHVTLEIAGKEGAPLPVRSADWQTELPPQPWPLRVKVRDATDRVHRFTFLQPVEAGAAPSAPRN